MRNYRNVISALALSFVLLTSVYAGDGVMHTGVIAPTPTPAPVTGGVTNTTDPADGETDGKGVMHTGASESAPSTTDIMIAEVAAVLMRSVLTLF